MSKFLLLALLALGACKPKCEGGKLVQTNCHQVKEMNCTRYTKWYTSCKEESHEECDSVCQMSLEKK